MKILFLTDNFPPEYNAPATRTYEHCKEWVRQGIEVTVITCAPNFPQGKVFDGYLNRWKQIEIVDGIKVIRVWSFISSNKGTFKRTLDFMSFAFTSFLAGFFVKCDLIIATSPQFFTAVSGCALGIVKRKKWIMEVRDIWPESIKAVEALENNWLLALLERIELFLYRHSDKVVVVTDSFKENICGRGTDRDKVHVVKNGVDISQFQPTEKSERLIQQLQIAGKFVVGYVGTHGMAHGLDFVIRCIKKLKDDSFHFLFIGDGAEKVKLIKLVNDLGLSNITFIDPIKKTEIKQYLSILDVALVPLRKSTTFQSVIPSKIFETVAMNIPILLGVNGETRSIIEHYNAGLYFEPENEQDFINKITSIKRNIRTNPEYYRRGCERMAADFDRKKLAAKMLSIIYDRESLSTNNPTTTS